MVGQLDSFKGVFFLDEIVKSKTLEQILFEEHLPSEPVDEKNKTPVSNETFAFNLSIFDQIKDQKLEKAAIRSHGPSGLDANE